MIEITRHYEPKDMLGFTSEDKYILKKEQIGIISGTSEFDVIM